jgi:hypothetical protein
MDESAVDKFYKYAMKMTPKSFENFQKVRQILNWKSNFTFHKYDTPELSEAPYWWTHYDGAKSGENFTTMEENELSAMIYFCKRMEEK